MKKLVWMMAGFGLAVVLAVAGMTVFAQTDTPPTPGGSGVGNGAACIAERGSGVLSDVMHSVMIQSFAEKLNLAAETLEARIAAGETMWQIAEAEGLSLEEFTTVMSEARTQALADAVAQGLITQEQADWMSTRMGGRMMGQGARGGYSQGGCTTGAGGQMPMGGRWSRGGR